MRRSTDADLAAEVAEDAAYAPYLARQESELRDLRASEALTLGDAFPYGEIPGLSREMVERLAASRPATLAAAGRVPGITPAALAALSGPCAAAGGMIASEGEAKDWLRTLPGCDPAAMARLERLVELLVAENGRQNLVSRASLAEVWRRHIADSAQLLRFVPRETTGAWLDLGTGAGFPGLVAAILQPDRELLMVESRAKRADWLERARIDLGLDHARACLARIETIESHPFAVISARAFAPLVRLIGLSARFSTPETLWLLPKGQSAGEELSSLREWSHTFHVEQSLTDADAGIIVGSLQARKGRNR